MNERIKELQEQAGWPKDTHQDDMYQVVGPDFAKKFAELMVKECAIHLHRRGIEGFGILEERNLLEHFGVEERKGWVCPKCGIDRTKDVCPKGHFATMTGDCPMTATAQSGVE